MIEGRAFYKMTGSGNDFVVFDIGEKPEPELERADVIRALCARGTGIGADGVVLLGRTGDGSPLMRYYNADGSRADLCGNATLCVTALSVSLGIAATGASGGFGISSDAGRIGARIVDGRPEIEIGALSDFQVAVADIQAEAGEQRIGFAKAGNPQLVVLCDDAAGVDLPARGPVLRRHTALGSAGANVNFVSRRGDTWSYRTFERGVEGETLACGSGAVATAALLAAWGLAKSPVTLRTASGLPVVVTLPARPDGRPSLRGEGRLVYEGRVRDLGDFK